MFRRAFVDWSDFATAGALGVVLLMAIAALAPLAAQRWFGW